VQNATTRLITDTRHRDHHTGTTRTPLPTHLRTRQVQSGIPGSPVVVQAGSSLLGRRLYCMVSDSTCRSLRSADAFWLAWHRKYSVVTVTELLQPRDLAYESLFRSRHHLRTVNLLRRQPKRYIFQ